MNRSWIALLALGFLNPAFGKTETPKKKISYSRQRSTLARKIASTESSPQYLDVKVSEGAAKPSKRELAFQLSFLSGISQADGAGTAGSALHFGVQGDLHWGRYLGAEFDAYFAPGLGETVAGSSVKMGQFGGLVDVKGRYAFRAGESAVLVPKLGVGFGAQGLSSSVTSSTGTEQSGSMKAMGLFLVGGLEARIARRFTLDLDYAQMLFGSGSLSATNLTTSSTVDSASFSRLRVSASYRLSVPISIGAQFTHRTVGVQMSSVSALDQSTGMNQFLGMLTLHW